MLTELQQALRSRGFAFASGVEFRALMDPHGVVSDAARSDFAASWTTMPPDPYLAREGMARRRRHAVFEAEGAEVRPMPPRPHYQSIHYNTLQGGFPRHLAAIDADILVSPALRQLVAFGAEFFAQVRGQPTQWEVEAHQFRIEASDGGEGLPTPEGRHRDGVDFVLVVLIQRVNLKSGTTSTYNDEGDELGAFTLQEPYDVALVDDRRVLHGVTPVSLSDPHRPGYRDVLVLTYRRRTEPPSAEKT